MTTFALILILIAAFIHAWWNYLLKRTTGGLSFFWLFSAVSIVLYAPLAVLIWIWQQPVMGWPQLSVIAASALIHAFYYLALDRGYRYADLSLVYPLARGTGPLLTLLGAVLLFDEHPSVIAISGALLIALGIVFLTGNPSAWKANGLGITFALLTGLLIAAYTLIDKQAVAVLLIPPLLYDWVCILGRFVLLTPLAWRERHNWLPTWNTQRKAILLIALLSPLSYILVLTVMQFTAVSYVAPAREISILIAVLLGSHFLQEGALGRRLFSALLMISGLVALALG